MQHAKKMVGSPNGQSSCVPKKSRLFVLLMSMTSSCIHQRSKRAAMTQWFRDGIIGKSMCLDSGWDQCTTVLYHQASLQWEALDLNVLEQLRDIAFDGQTLHNSHTICIGAPQRQGGHITPTSRVMVQWVVTCQPAHSWHSRVLTTQCRNKTKICSVTRTFLGAYRWTRWLHGPKCLRGSPTPITKRK